MAMNNPNLVTVVNKDWIYPPSGLPNGKRAERDLGKLLNSGAMAMDDPDLVALVKKDWIYPPSGLPYKLTASKKTDYSQRGESGRLDTLMGQKTGGFFLECGAADGETLAVSLFFEKVRGWSGLLIEANPEEFAELQTKNRKAYSSGTCLSTVKHPEKVQFRKAGLKGGIQKNLSNRNSSSNDVVEVQCFPLYTMLLALKVPTVDLFVLDIEGAEAMVLRTIPFERVQINFIYLEHNYKEKNKREISEVLLNNGYEHVEEFEFNIIYRLKGVK